MPNSKSRQTSNIVNRLSVTDRTALLSKIGTRVGETILQENISLVYTWKDDQLVADNGGTELYVGTGRWSAGHYDDVDVAWFDIDVADISIAINKASQVGRCYLENGTYSSLGQIVLENSFNGNNSRINFNVTGIDKLMYSDKEIEISNVRVSGQDCPNDDVESGIYIDASDHATGIGASIIGCSALFINGSATVGKTIKGIAIEKSAAATQLGGRYLIDKCSVYQVTGADVAKGITFASVIVTGGTHNVSITNCIVEDVHPWNDADCYWTFDTARDEAIPKVSYFIDNCIAKDAGKRGFKFQAPNIHANNLTVFIDNKFGEPCLTGISMYGPNQIVNNVRMIGENTHTLAIECSGYVNQSVDNCQIDFGATVSSISSVSLHTFIVRGGSDAIFSNFNVKTKFTLASNHEVAGMLFIYDVSKCVINNVIYINSTGSGYLIKQLGPEESSVLISSCDLSGSFYGFYFDSTTEVNRANKIILNSSLVDTKQVSYGSANYTSIVEANNTSFYYSEKGFNRNATDGPDVTLNGCLLEGISDGFTGRKITATGTTFTNTNTIVERRGAYVLITNAEIRSIFKGCEFNRYAEGIYANSSPDAQFENNSFIACTASIVQNAFFTNYQNNARP